MFDFDEDEDEGLTMVDLFLRTRREMAMAEAALSRLIPLEADRVSGERSGEEGINHAAA